MKKFSEMTDKEREVSVFFRKYASGPVMTMHELEKMGEDMDLDFDLLRALVDDDGNHQISFEEFFRFWTNEDKFKYFHGDKKDQLDSWLAEFRKIDTNGDGTLCVDELKAFCASRNVEIDIDQLLKSIDHDNSGTIGFEEFLIWYQVI